ncbi:MAG: SRPBCC family protein [Armatimonadetes bacterium]|nr:SRPBCC family protein [Armatimonadota bacterium]
MEQIRVSRRVQAPIERVARVVLDFHGLAEWHPGVAKSQDASHGDRSLRRLTLADGAKLVEVLEGSTPHRYRYRIVESPFPMESYESELSVRPLDEGGCQVEWTGKLTAADPESAAAMAETVREFYIAGLEGLDEKLGVRLV